MLGFYGGWERVYLTSRFYLRLLMLGFYGGVGAGLFNLSILFEIVGEPAPTSLLKMI